MSKTLKNIEIHAQTAQENIVMCSGFLEKCRWAPFSRRIFTVSPWPRIAAMLVEKHAKFFAEALLETPRNAWKLKHSNILRYHALCTGQGIQQVRKKTPINNH
eukprot:gnl/TRDRNA2_/TRDRNA2_156486_c2_seq1.p3 gnl/TRDRNA2_/TRDRNA2_156486_c2~~gnl/TRDRNA2_/TRDRNA2_156486_c2_seq1.p3  ORF type:complete len:112 (+),score=15.19 gnl/TRDRNA2_/TRDRNA2_156486_c2_seq1:29-337(+)